MQPPSKSTTNTFTQIVSTINWLDGHTASNALLYQNQMLNCQTIQKLIHEWLPLETQYQNTSNSINKVCPSCQQHPKTVGHFLQCTHLNFSYPICYKIFISQCLPPMISAPTALPCTENHWLNQLYYGQYSHTWASTFFCHDPTVSK